jgi:hypothetical protein
MKISDRHTLILLALMLVSLPVYAQGSDREQVLADDIKRLGERALRDRVISDEEHTQMLCFVRDSLPEGTDLKVRALEQIRDELDEKYSEQVRQMGGVYDIIMPGGRPDNSWRHAPKMAYDPHPDEHFRR